MEWEESLDGALLVKVMAMREKIESIGIITSVKSLGDGLYEKKWKSGLRIYFAVIFNTNRKSTLLLLGSGKHREQEKAIQRSRYNLSKYVVIKDSILKKD